MLRTFRQHYDGKTQNYIENTSLQHTCSTLNFNLNHILILNYIDKMNSSNICEIMINTK
jgi:capsule polysaccharide export protein KpsC/LpsZ